MLKVITQRSIILDVADLWDEQYRYVMPDGTVKWFGLRGGNESISKKLHALDLKTCTVEDVNSITGNNYWTSMHCSQCNTQKFPFIEIEAGSESSAILCAACVSEAMKMLQPHLEIDCQQAMVLPKSDEPDCFSICKIGDIVLVQPLDSTQWYSGRVFDLQEQPRLVRVFSGYEYFLIDENTSHKIKWHKS